MSGEDPRAFVRDLARMCIDAPKEPTDFKDKLAAAVAQEFPGLNNRGELVKRLQAFIAAARSLGDFLRAHRGALYRAEDATSPPEVVRIAVERRAAAAARGEAWATRPEDTMCVCGHPRSRHASKPSGALPPTVLACTVPGCACGPGCIHEGFVDASGR